MAACLFLTQASSKAYEYTSFLPPYVQPAVHIRPHPLFMEYQCAAGMPQPCYGNFYWGEKVIDTPYAHTKLSASFTRGQILLYYIHTYIRLSMCAYTLLNATLAASNFSRGEQNHGSSSGSQPDRPFHNFRASKSGHRRILCTSSSRTANNGLWNSKKCKWVGREVCLSVQPCKPTWDCGKIKSADISTQFFPLNQLCRHVFS